MLFRSRRPRVRLPLLTIIGGADPREQRNEDHTVFPKDAEDAGLVFWDGISMKVRGVDVLGEDEEELKDRIAMEHEVNTAPTRL